MLKKRVAVPEVSKIILRVSPGWTRHLLLLRLGSGKEVKIASRIEPAAALDPFYDGINLDFDTWWAEAIARALGKVTGIEVELPESR
jgi:hypothetical protein